jgi:HPt (histidine-containing phosphotransfer) domain-containing protein
MSAVASAADEARDGRQGKGPAPCIDLTYLRRFTLDNTALEREVLELFADQAPLYLAALRGARHAKAWSEAAHTLKGSARAVGAWRVAAAAEALEAAGYGSAGEDGPLMREATEAVAEARHFIALHCGGI